VAQYAGNGFSSTDIRLVSRIITNQGSCSGTVEEYIHQKASTVDQVLFGFLLVRGGSIYADN
jgi:hypothetical protein